MGLFANIFRQGAVLHVNCMQAPSKPPVKLASSLAVKKPPSPLAISPCMGEPPVKLASSWQERHNLHAGYVCRLRAAAGHRLGAEGRTRHWCRRVEVQNFFYKTRDMWLPYACFLLLLVSSSLHSFLLILLLPLHCFFSWLFISFSSTIIGFSLSWFVTSVTSSFFFLVPSFRTICFSKATLSSSSTTKRFLFLVITALHSSYF